MLFQALGLGNGDKEITGTDTEGEKLPINPRDVQLRSQNNHTNEVKGR